MGMFAAAGGALLLKKIFEKEIKKSREERVRVH